MQKFEINLTDEFKENICSFYVAKKAKAAGMNSANTFYAYDEEGQTTDAGWMESENNLKMLREQLKNPRWMPPVMYPAINLPFAIGMLEDTTIDHKKLECWEEWDEEKGTTFFFKTGDDVMQNTKLVDLMVEVWIKYKKKD